jgi:biotin carboxyl carrier protein
MEPLVDLTDVRRLIDIVQRHGLQGLTVTDERDVEVRIVAAAPLAGAPASEPAPFAPAATAELPEPPAGGHRLLSPITGVFYRSPTPADPPFAQVGDVIEPDDPVCLIEAMKIFNEIPAGCHGRLTRVAVTNEQLVVTGEVLMEFAPLGDDD